MPPTPRFRRLAPPSPRNGRRRCRWKASERKFLTGNWGGKRDGLREYGIEPFAYYTADPAGIVSGGRSKDFNYADDWFFGVNVNLEKLIGWKGARLVINGINRDGSSIQANVGSIYDPQQSVGGQTIFLYNVTLEQFLFDGKFSLKVGRFGACDDFNNSPIYNLYMNNGIDGDIRNVLFNTQFAAYPFATWAARLRYNFTAETYVKLGVFQTTENVFDRDTHGLDWSIGGSDGVTLIAQVGWTPQLFKRTVAASGSGASSAGDGKDGKSSATQTKVVGMPGHYHVGVTFSPWEGYRQFGRRGLTENSYGFYAHADQMVYQETPGSEQGLTLWAAGGYYPQHNISIVPFQVNGGLIYQGLLPNRDTDRALLGLIFGKFSRDYASVVEAAGNGRPDYEFVLEAAYRFQIAKYAYIQPDLQWIVRPGGTGRVADAVVLGTMVGLTF